MKIHLLSGFLGSGKTTAIEQAVRILTGRNVSCGVITNDQGIHLVDSNFFQRFNIPNSEVVNGCFCCNFEELDKSIDAVSSELVFAESVGSCTDLVATVLKPLLQRREGVVATMSTFADVRLLNMFFSTSTSVLPADVKYVYSKQLEEASIIVVNKIDLIDQQTLLHVKHKMQRRYKGKTILYQNSLDVDSIQEWLNNINDSRTTDLDDSLQMDYDRYAAGEAMLAWLDAQLSFTAKDGEAMECAEEFINGLYASIANEKLMTGHLKFLVDNSIKISFTSAYDSVVSLRTSKADKVDVLVNIRVQAEPERLRKLLMETIEALPGHVEIESLDCFRPGYPKPTYRIE